MIVVCNTSPIIALACAGRLDLLRSVHGEILVPDAVFDEITVAGSGEPGASEVAQAAWIKLASRDTIDIRALKQTWAAFDRVAHLRPIRSEEEYDRTVTLMNFLLDVVGDKEDHALSGLLDLVGELVGEYDTNHYAIEAAEPKEALRYLIEMRGLKQGDLAEIVPQSNLSAILAGKGKISATLAGKLARYFNVSPAVFVPV